MDSSQDSSSSAPAAAPPNLPRDDASRGTQEEDRMYAAFDSYPWAKDPKFAGLLRGLAKGGPQAMDERKTRLARITYYSRILGMPINGEQYAEWLSNHPEHQSPDPTLAAMFSAPGGPGSISSADSQATPRPLWQANAPKADLYIEKKMPTTEGNADEPAYPSKFAELIKCIQEGRPVPGVREIANTLVRDPSVKPFGSRSAPKKPWEKDVVQPAGEGSVASELAIDQEFPPLEEIKHAEPVAGGANNEKE